MLSVQSLPSPVWEGYSNVPYLLPPSHTLDTVLIRPWEQRNEDVRRLSTFLSTIKSPPSPVHIKAFLGTIASPRSPVQIEAFRCASDINPGTYATRRIDRSLPFYALAQRSR
ncbi:uncharacterized protein N7515_002546 [Penicillium bovifimosum]|uniref:Uncharacterized protein n=1 Tax=Penicillium bovifimosum TaxID=126998 RepID=A0A9W9L9R6_9EURO|nr:uncharacterized protein N7515_002546 [Penicillium bovifimosum]KAJ5143759.1 hypothetical protein N7515_002546 [Penicillium bovifimosum]